MSRSTVNWLTGIAATLVTALIIGAGTTLASDHEKVIRLEEVVGTVLPRLEEKVDDLDEKLDLLLLKQ